MFYSCNVVIFRLCESADDVLSAGEPSPSSSCKRHEPEQDGLPQKSQNPSTQKIDKNGLQTFKMLCCLTGEKRPAMST